MTDFLSRIITRQTNNLFIQLFRYTIVGGLAFFVDYGLLILLTEAAGLHYLVSATISFLAGLYVNYYISVRWVFRKSIYKSKLVDFAVFTLVGLIGLVFNNMFLYFFTEMLSFNYILSKPITAVIVYMWNFLARRFFIFNGRQETASEV